MYLDHAAATPIDERVLQAMQPYFSDRFFNPSAPYAPAVEVRREYEAAKAGIALRGGFRATLPAREEEDLGGVVHGDLNLGAGGR